MPQKIVDAEGKEHEVLTQEEIDAKVQAAVSSKESELKSAIEEKDTRLGSLQSELETAREALDKAGEGTKDWASARGQIKGLEAKIGELEQARNREKEEFSGEIRKVRTAVFQGQVDSMIKNLSGEDEELKKKIEFQYNRLGVADNEKDAQEKMKDAFLLATGRQAPNMFNVARGTGGDAPRVNQPASQELSELGSRFGLSDEDIKKYGNKANAKK
jgi:chromosome segregation ATPase